MLYKLFVPQYTTPAKSNLNYGRKVVSFYLRGLYYDAVPEQVVNPVEAAATRAAFA